MTGRGGMLLGRRRGEQPPDSPRDLVLVLRQDAAAGPDVLAATRAAAAGGTVAVVLPLKIHGYSLGLPNPGLMPTARERAVAETAITDTVRRLRAAGVDVDGEIVVTRHADRAVVGIVRRRGASQVLIDQVSVSRARRFVEGDVVRRISRRLGSAVTVSAPWS